jgi:uncharacterized damage-inducible protein DinB
MSIRPVFSQWSLLNDRLTQALTPLSAEQLAHPAAPGRWPLWAVVGHMACQRVFWLCDFAGEPGAETTRFTNAAWNCPGDDDLDHPLDAVELVDALTSTFAIVDRALDTWMYDRLDEQIVHADWGPEWRHTRGFVIERVYAHDNWHAAEVNEILTRLDLDPVDPWN